jgi:hypothetical protein
MRIQIHARYDNWSEIGIGIFEVFFFYQKKFDTSFLPFFEKRFADCKNYLLGKIWLISVPFVVKNDCFLNLMVQNESKISTTLSVLNLH